jgi:AcrR family transcriptional regulator
VDEILDAAEALFLEAGPAATSIQDIARRAGASMGSMYHFFPTKESLLAGLRVRHREEARQLLAAMRDAIEGAEGLPLRAFVERMLAPLAEFVERRPAVFVLADPGSPQDGENDDADRAVRDAFVVALRKRHPACAPAELARRADVIGAIGRGIADLLAHADASARHLLVEQMSRAIYGYLLTFEEDAIAAPR